MAYRDLQPEEWLEQIDQGLEYRRRFGLEDLWGQMESIYYSVHESMVNDGPNILLSQGDAMLSMLTVPTPRVKVKALTPEDVDKAPLVEAMDNMFLEELRLNEVVEDACLQAYLFGTGIIKVGYDSEWGYDPSLDLGGSMKLGLTLSQMDKTGSRQIEYDAGISPGMPWCRAVMPHDIVVPWGIRDIDTAPWIAHRVVRHLDDLKSDRKYSNTRRLTPQISMRDFVDSYRTPLKMLRRMNVQDPEYIEFYEVHDRRTGKILAVTWNHDKFLRNDENLLQINNRLPFAAISFTPRARSFWTTPDAYYLLHIQNELSDIARQRTKQRRLSVLKFLYDAGSITDAELEKILSPDVGVAAKIESGRDITKAIIKLENTPSQFLTQEEEVVRANAREQIGFSRNQLGEYTGGRKTAREVNAVERSSQLRMSRRGLRAKRLYEDSLRLINGVVFTHWTLGRYVQVIGEEATDLWAKINGPSLAGRYSYKIDLIDEEQEESESLQALQLYGLLSQDPSIDPIALRKHLTQQVNDPAFGRLFNADIRAQMHGVPAGGGGVQSQGARKPQSGPSPMQQMQGQNGEANLQTASRFLAGGGSGS